MASSSLVGWFGIVPPVAAGEPPGERVLCYV